MRSSQSSKRLLFVLKCIIVFLVFLLIVCVPWFKLWAASNPSSDNSGWTENFNNLLTMLGGGGLGVAGSNAIRQRSQQPINQQNDSETSGLLITLPGLHQEIKDNRRKQLKEYAAIREELKKIKYRINSINDFLERKYEDFKSKDTLY